LHLLIKTSFLKGVTTVDLAFMGKYPDCKSAMEEQGNWLLQNTKFNSMIMTRNMAAAIHHDLMWGSTFGVAKSSIPSKALDIVTYFDPKEKAERIEFRIVKCMFDKPTRLIELVDNDTKK